MRDAPDNGVCRTHLKWEKQQWQNPSRCYGSSTGYWQGAMRQARLRCCILRWNGPKQSDLPITRARFAAPNPSSLRSLSITGDFEDFATTPSEFLAQGDRVISIGNYSGVARATKRHLLAPFVHTWTVLDGALRRFDQYTDSAAWKEPLSQ